MKTVAEEHAKRLQKVHERAEKGTHEAYLTKVDLLLYVDAKGLRRADYGLKENSETSAAVTLIRRPARVS